MTRRMCPYRLALGYSFYCTEECPVDKCAVPRDIIDDLQEEVAELKAKLKDTERKYAGVK